EVRCQMCSSRRCRRDVASRAVADSGRVSPFGVSLAGVDGAPVVGEPLLCWNSESMANPGDGLLRGLLAFSGRAFPLGPIPLPLSSPLAFTEAFRYRAAAAGEPQPMRFGSS